MLLWQRPEAAQRISIQHVSWRDGSVRRRLFSTRKDEKSVYRRSSAIFADCPSCRPRRPAKLIAERPRCGRRLMRQRSPSARGSISAETPAVVSLPNENDVRRRCFAVRWSVGARGASVGRRTSDRRSGTSVDVVVDGDATTWLSRRHRRPRRIFAITDRRVRRRLDVTSALCRMTTAGFRRLTILLFTTRTGGNVPLAAEIYAPLAFACSLADDANYDSCDITSNLPQ